MPDVQPLSPAQARRLRAWVVVRFTLGLAQMIGKDHTSTRCRRKVSQCPN
jgi:hypothetical protein